MDVMRGKITVNVKEQHKNRKRKNTCTPEKTGSALSRERTLELQQ
jgi:hypothetical protein